MTCVPEVMPYDSLGNKFCDHIFVPQCIQSTAQT